jgi:excisionase family DNA binding protein
VSFLCKDALVASIPGPARCQMPIFSGWRRYFNRENPYTNKNLVVGCFPLPKETHGMTTDTNLATILNAVSDLIAAQSSQRLAEFGREGGRVRPRLFSVEDAALYLGRSKKAVQHLIAFGKLPTVKADRRVFLDRKDLDEWIERSKSQ